MTALLPAPQIAALLPARCPIAEPARLNHAGQLDTKRIHGPKVYITTSAGTFAVLDDLCVGDALAELAGKVELIGELEWWEAA